VTGTPVTISMTNTASVPDIRSAISASATGLLTFGGDTPTVQLVWYSRTGAKLNALPPQNLRNPDLSPDERYAAAEGGPGDRAGVWIIDGERGVSTRLTDGLLPVWHPSGRNLVFTSRDAGGNRLWNRTIAAPPEQRTALVGGVETKIGGNWSLDGRFLVYVSSSPDTRMDIWILSTVDGTEARP
jgi:Tol biopolymer transport system component